MRGTPKPWRRCLPICATASLRAGNADQGAATLEYLQSALVDLAFHRGAPLPIRWRGRPRLAALDAPAAIPMCYATPHFAHVFTGDGYSSGYYSYLWSEVMDADAFEAFREAGTFSTRKPRAGWKNPSSRAADRRLRISFGSNLGNECRGLGPLLVGRGLI